MPENQNNNAEIQQAVNLALKEEKKKKKGKKLLIIGIIIAVIAFISMIAGGSDDNKGSNSGGSVAASKQEQVKGKIGNYVCTIKSATLCKNWDGKDSVKITYEFTNNYTEAESFDIALSDYLYQDGIGLESTFISADDDDWGIDVKIKPGTTKEVSKVYVLRDTQTVIDVEISEFISFSDEKLTYQVELEK